MSIPSSPVRLLESTEPSGEGRSEVLVWSKETRWADGGKWMSGWYGSVASSVASVDNISSPSPVLPKEVSWDEPKDLKAPPEIPEGAEGKYWSTD